MERKSLKKLVRKALAEDVDRGDLTTHLTVPEGSRCVVTLIAKQDGCLSGIEVFRAVFRAADAETDDWQALADGHAFKNGEVVASFKGRTWGVLTGERTALNFVQHLSGVATLTAAYVSVLEGLETRICDTRKTTPFLRTLEKEAVLHGGGTNHRRTLHDSILIKDNHIEAAGGIKQAVAAARQGTHHLMKVEVEVRTLIEYREALDTKADVIMLDNMTDEETREAVVLAKGSRVTLEASGNMTLDRVRGVAETGVHHISVGALTHSAPSIDLSLQIVAAKD